LEKKRGFVFIFWANVEIKNNVFVSVLRSKGWRLCPHFLNNILLFVSPHCKKWLSKKKTLDDLKAFDQKLPKKI
jgi:hypothetical protein